MTKFVLLFITLSAVLCMSVMSVSGQTTAFTYQGRLTLSDASANACTTSVQVSIRKLGH